MPVANRTVVITHSSFQAAASEPVRTLAASYKDPALRSPDAIHLATAQMLANRAGEPVATFVSYDKRLLIAARAAGLPVASPGAAA